MNSDAIIKPNIKPITLHVDSIISKTVGDIKCCEACGEIMRKSMIYPYNSKGVNIFICENKECSQYNKYKYRGRTFSF